LALAVPVVAKPQGKTTPAPAPAAPAATEGEDQEGTIPGVSAKRSVGDGYIGVTIDNAGFKLAFYDAKKKQVPCDVARASARWNPAYKHGDERKMLNPSGDGMTLVSSDVRPPYNFKLWITLFSEDDKALETIVVDFRG
jgi:hypothetical protein